MEGDCNCPVGGLSFSGVVTTGLGISRFLKRSVELLDGSRRCYYIVSTLGVRVPELSLEQGKSIAWVMLVKPTDLTNPL